MADYTIELRRIVESHTFGQTLDRRAKIEAGRTKVFDFDYPIFDEDYRKTFETHFLTHFWMREIGFETVGLFKMRLEDWLNLNMGYYNALFESEKLTYDPLSNSKMDTTHTKSNVEDSDSSMNGTSNTSDTTTTGATKYSNENLSEVTFGRDLTSNTPDSRLTITSNDGEGVIEYASEIDETFNRNTRNGTANVSTNTDQNSALDTNSAVQSEATKKADEDFTQHREGKIGVQSYAKLMMEYRKSLLRIEKDCFNEMNELFMLVY